MNCWENVIYGPKVKGFDMQNAERIGHEVLEMVKLHERLDTFPNELSGGMMQRIAVARALAAGARLLLLDEPLGHLDAKVRNELRYEIRRMAKDLELTAIHVTHDQSEAMAISDRIAVMKKDKVLQVGTPQELYMKTQSIFVANFIGGANFLEGYIAEAKGETATIKLRGGLKIQAINKGINTGERVVLAVKPETFTITKGKKKEKNAVSGIIERVAFEGTNIRYEVRLENEDLIVVVTPSMACQWFNIGEKVTVSFQPENAHLFAYPEVGLREEIAVE